VLIDHPPQHRFHVATLDAIRHATQHVGGEFSVEVVRTDHVGALGDGLVIGPGTPYRDPTSAEQAITEARQRGIPLVAT
jgi:hypothetical protein